MKDYICREYENMLNTLRELCRIPAPSHCERARAEYIRDFLLNIGASEVYIDKALNVILPINCLPINCENKTGFTVVCAHTDTVFPDEAPMPVTENEEYIYSPGVGDDTASVAVLLYAIKYLLSNQRLKDKRVMFVFNSGEEGLGNLKGTRALFDEFGTRIESFITLDSQIGTAVDHSVGSCRYKVAVTTDGGHSYNKFGNENAINALSGVIKEIYSIEVPKKEGTKTTYNVGTISGGTSVNTIAQNAEMLCEYRSSNRECLEYMEEQFRRIFESTSSEKVQIEVTQVGNRPCMGEIPEEGMKRLRCLITEIERECVGGGMTVFKSGSTDCNIPHSLGIPAICIGVYRGSKSHTREEEVEKASLKEGLEIAIKYIERI